MGYKTMSKRFTNDFRFCYPVLEHSTSDFSKKALSVSQKDNSLIELRIDYLLAVNIGIESIINCINEISKFVGSNRLISTIRTKDDGGDVQLSDEEYCHYIKELYLSANTSYIDIEYEYFKRNEILLNSLLKNRKKTVILSKHIFDGALNTNEYEKLFKDMTFPLIDIVKCAILITNESELFEYMMIARKCSKYIENEGKSCIFIAMGEIGRLSRLWPEFTNTKIVFLTAYAEKPNKIGQLGCEDFVKYRKLLEKIDKNW